MNSGDQLSTLPEPNLVGITPPQRRRVLKSLLVFSAALVLCFAKPIAQMLNFAAHSQFYSHLPLIPFISGYFVWLIRKDLPLDGTPRRGWAVAFGVVGLILLSAFWALATRGGPFPQPDRLALTISSFLCFFVAGCAALLPAAAMRRLIFPLAMLAFMVPFPEFIDNALETFFQHTSALAAELMFTVVGADFYRDGLVIALPNITLEVAPECSGIRSSLVLCITSFIAGKMFLNSHLNRAFLAGFVVPLAIARNGFRIFTLGWLCSNVDPDIINSALHHRGGPIFFALSLIPFFAFLWWLRRRERNLRSPR